jgi:hypothetical protein
MPLISEPALFFKSLQTGIRLALKELGVQHAGLALTGAATIALEQPDALQQWMAGGTVFNGAEFPGPADEESSLNRFSRQAKREAQGGKLTLQRALLPLIEQPGAWASYTTSGTVPSLDTRTTKGEENVQEP